MARVRVFLLTVPFALAQRLRLLTHGLIISALLLVMALQVNAAEKQSTQTGEKWQFSVEPYVWAAAVDLKPTGGDEINISFSDVLDDLDFAFMTALGARKGKWSLLADIIYMKLSHDESATAELIGIPIKTSVDAKLEAWLVTVGGGYTAIETDKFSLDLLAGTRYLWLNAPLKFRIGPIKRKVTPDSRDWDGIIGVRGTADLSDQWYLSYYLDGGTGDSDFTWQAKTALNYKFNKVDAVAGYRYLHYDINGRQIDDFTLKGPYLGVKFRF